MCVHGQPSASIDESMAEDFDAFDDSAAFVQPDVVDEEERKAKADLAAKAKAQVAAEVGITYHISILLSSAT